MQKYYANGLALTSFILLNRCANLLLFQIILQYRYAPRNALLDGRPACVAQSTVCASEPRQLDEHPTRYRSGDQRWKHKVEIQSHYGFGELPESVARGELPQS